MPEVTLTDAPLTLEELLAVVDGAPVALGPAAWDAVHAGRAVLAAAVARGDAVYGVNTEVGHGRDVRLDDEGVRRQQLFLILSHAGGLGPPLPTAVVRAAMAVRLAGFARGGAAASPRAVEVLAAMLGAGVHPVVPAIGSVGAGDLGQMAFIAQVAIGVGRAEHGGEVLPGSEALRRAGIAPLVPEGRDGLALISSNGVSVGQAALVVARAARMARVADLVAALSFEAVRANPSVALPAVGAAKPYPGQVAACAAITAALAGGDLLAPGAARSVQDPLSFRVVPQVHGALRELVAFLRRAVQTELGARADNPLAAVQEGAMVSNGNFCPLVLALAADGLRGALAHVGQLADRRLSHLWEAFMAAMAAGAVVAADGAPEVLGLALRYPAAARAAELKQLAAPATLDAPPLDLGVEDHGTSAPLSVAKADEALDLLEDLLAVEALMARDVLATLPAPPALGAGTGALLGDVEKALAGVADRRPDTVHRAVRAALPTPADPLVPA